MNRADRGTQGMDVAPCFRKRKTHKWFTLSTGLEGCPGSVHGHRLLALAPTWTSTVGGARQVMSPVPGCFTSCEYGVALVLPWADGSIS